MSLQKRHERRLAAMQRQLADDKELARELTAQMTEVLAYYKLLRVREITEHEAFAELLAVQKEQGKRLDALQSEYGQILRELIELRDDVAQTRGRIGKASDRTERQVAKLDDFVARLADILARMSGELLQKPKLLLGNRAEWHKTKKES